MLYQLNIWRIPTEIWILPRIWLAHYILPLSGVDVMSECTTFCLILTVFQLKNYSWHVVYISVPEIGHLWTTVTFNNPFLF